MEAHPKKTHISSQKKSTQKKEQTKEQTIECKMIALVVHEEKKAKEKQ